MDKYTCKECGSVAVVKKDGKVVKSCQCKGPVIMDMGKVTLKGIGGVK